jgi:hypothetical protein
MCPDPEFPDFSKAKVGSTANKAKDIAAVWNMGSWQLDVYMVGMDNRMWHSPQAPDGSFPDFTQRPVGSPANKALGISAVSRSDGLSDVYMVGLDNRMWHSPQAPDGSFPDFAQRPVGSSANKALRISVVYVDEEIIPSSDVYMVGLDNQMWHSRQAPGFA